MILKHLACMLGGLERLLRIFLYVKASLPEEKYLPRETPEEGHVQGVVHLNKLNI